MHKQLPNQLLIEQKIFNFDDMYNYQKEKNSVEIARYTLKKARTRCSS